MKPHTFHHITTKQIGDRVMVPIHPASGDTAYYYGTVIHRTMHDYLEVEWDHYIPHLGKVTNLTPAILV